jgi:hypothetical protein
MQTTGLTVALEKLSAPVVAEASEIDAHLNVTPYKEMNVGR